MEHNKKRPDVPAVAEKTVGAAITGIAGTLSQACRYLFSGKSFGGRMSSHYLSKNEIAGVKGIIFMASRYIPRVILPRIAQRI